jgi:hypothetical protein
VVSFYPVAIASRFVEQTDTPWFFLPFLIAFGAMLPLAAIGGLATVAADVVAERRARRLMRPRPRLVYLFMALGWALAGGAGALLAWAAGARSTGPGAGEDWIATGLVWGTMISACATLMMISRTLTAGTAGRPSWLSGVRRTLLAGSSAASADPAVIEGNATAPDN